MSAAQWAVTLAGAALVALVNAWFFGARKKG